MAKKKQLLLNIAVLIIVLIVSDLPGLGVLAQDLSEYCLSATEEFN